MSQPHGDDARGGREPFTLIIDEAPMVSPGTDDDTRGFINTLMHDLAQHARRHPITLR